MYYGSRLIRDSVLGNLPSGGVPKGVPAGDIRGTPRGVPTDPRASGSSNGEYWPGE